MSVTTNAATVRNELPHRRRRPAAEPRSLRILEYVAAVPVVALLIWESARNWNDFWIALPAILPWLLVVAAADLLPVPIWRSVELMMSFPVLLAAAFVFPPHLAGLVSFVGTIDTREFRREISAGRGLFNRSNVALSVMAASWVFHRMDGTILAWPEVLAFAFVALLVDLAINAGLVILGTSLLTGLPATRLVHNVYGGSQPVAFIGGYACFGLLAVVLATVYVAAGGWGLVAFAIPLLLARQMFVHWKSLAEAKQLIAEKNQLFTHVSNRVADERRDERLAVAAGIHDEVLPPLYKVHLMGQVLRQDLASGRLLDLEADLPDLLQATETASSALRDLIGDLRRSTLGSGGLGPTLQLLANDVSNDSGITIEVRVQPVAGTPLTHLLLYQVAREALANAVRHSGADKALVVLEDVGHQVRLVVEDNGRGFEPRSIDETSHFGLQLMRERVELAGGTLSVETSSPKGARVVVEVPVER